MVRAIRAHLIVGGLGLVMAAGCAPGDVEDEEDGEPRAEVQTALAPTADATVKRSSAGTNFGRDTTLLVDTSPEEMKALVTFSVPALGGPVLRAKLRLFAVNGSPDGPKVYRTSASWSETGVTWNNSPGPSGPVLADAGAVGTGWYELDVTGAVTAAGSVSFLLLSDSVDGVDFSSRESANRPQLVITTGVGISHVGTTSSYDRDGQALSIARPAGTVAGDLLLLTLHRTDDDLPLYVDGWTRVAECYKRDNGFDCSTEDDCTRWHDDDFCAYFGDRGREGHDLAQAIFYRVAGANEPGTYRFDLNVDSSGHPGWAILTTLRGASTSDPVRDWANTGCDRSTASVFPSVFGRAGDLLLLSQSFDDPATQAQFGAPSGMGRLGYVVGNDETGYLFGGTLTATGVTGPRRTSGSGGSDCKDALLSLVIRAR